MKKSILKIPGAGLLPEWGAHLESLANEFPAGILAVEPWIAYDTLRVPEDVKDDRLRWFQNTIGTAPRGWIDTNQLVPGSMPGNCALIVHGWSVLPGHLLGWAYLNRQGHVTLRVGDRYYLRSPLQSVPMWQTPVTETVEVETRFAGRVVVKRTVRRELGMMPISPPLVILPFRPFCVEAGFVPMTFPAQFRAMTVTWQLHGYVVRGE